MAKLRIINGKGDSTATPPTGADDHDLQSFANDFVIQSGVVDLNGGDCLVTESGTPGMHVQVAAGTVYVENSSWTQNSTEPRYYIVTRDSAETNVTISSNPSGSTRIDLVCQEIDKVTTPNDTGSNVVPITVVEGTPGSGQPATPNDHELLAVVTVADGATSITNSEIEDSRQQINFKPTKKRVTSEASSATPTPNADTTDIYILTALAAAAELQNPSGTPTDGQGLIVRIKDNGTARALTYDTQYRAVGQELPSHTVVGETTYLEFVYNSADTKWDTVAIKIPATTVAFSARIGTTQGYTASSAVKVNFDTEHFDNGSNFNTTDKRFVAPVNGLYHFTAKVFQADITTGNAATIHLYKNGSEIERYRIFSNGTGALPAQITSVKSLNKDDYIEVFWACGNNGSLVNNTGYSEFSGYKLL
jgi:hypothetical protein